MKKRPFMLAVLFFIAIAAYFVFSSKKEKKPVPMVNMTTFPDLKQVVNLSSGINPSHGQPGHRCDIAVGTPLPPAGTPSAVPQPSFNPVTSAPPAQTPVSGSSAFSAAKNTSQKINPPHGQPGHRCDVKTGDPLPGTQQVVPPKQNVTTVPGAVSAESKLNPAHGESGHRCDIQVGAPLPG